MLGVRGLKWRIARNRVQMQEESLKIMWNCSPLGEKQSLASHRHRNDTGRFEMRRIHFESYMENEFEEDKPGSRDKEVFTDVLETPMRK